MAVELQNPSHVPMHAALILRNERTDESAQKRALKSREECDSLSARTRHGAVVPSPERVTDSYIIHDNRLRL